ncbi:hypothetical protein GGR51DRAFT_562696 [Nemania sp. FL0031]|nr:hypothetical protein GGR51DRAFT_562696 [Nemania sp. FL0031]
MDIKRICRRSMPPGRRLAGDIGPLATRQLIVEEIMNQFPQLSTSFPSHEPSKAPQSSKETGYFTDGRKIYTLGDGYMPFFIDTKLHINGIITATSLPLKTFMNSRKDTVLLNVDGFFITSLPRTSFTLYSRKILASLLRLSNSDPADRRLNQLLNDIKRQEQMVEPIIVIDCSSRRYAKRLRRKILKYVHLQWGNIVVTVVIGNRGVDWDLGTPDVDKGERQRRNQER